MAISLSHAARELGVTPNGLRRWIKRAHIELVSDPTDRRKRVLRDEDFERLHDERIHANPTDDMVDEEDTLRRYAALVGEIDALHEAVTRRSDVINKQIATLFSQMTELAERVSRLEDTLRKAG